AGTGSPTWSSATTASSAVAGASVSTPPTIRRTVITAAPRNGWSGPERRTRRCAGRGRQCPGVGPVRADAGADDQAPPALRPGAAADPGLADQLRLHRQAAPAPGGRPGRAGG